MVKRFLLIDDDSDDRELFSEALASVSSVIVCDLAADAEEALDKLVSKELDTPDMIFLDINLPVMTGWQFLTSLKSQEAYKDIPVIMYSTSSNQRDKDIAKDLGALCFITKPSAFKKLQHTLDIIVSYSNRRLYHLLCSAINELKN
jgi:CheY-like chemotaxis protein